MRTFRMAGNYPYIHNVADCTPITQVDQFLEQASRLCDISDVTSACLTADAVGSPECVVSHGLRASGTTARYVFQLAVLRRLFGNLDGFRIAEIGGGYGGMACLLLSRYPSVTYTCYDLPLVGRLQRFFLACSAVPILRDHWPLSIDPNAIYDLSFSYCAYGELDAPTRAQYAETILKASRMGCIQVSDGRAEPRELQAFLSDATGHAVHSVSDRPDASDFPGNGRFFLYWDCRSQSP